jgi:hypothetical protein
MIGPLILAPPADLEHMRGVVWSLLSAVGLLAALGIRYPLQMLPVLFFELIWKSIWIVAIGFERWAGGTLTAAEGATWSECLISLVIFTIAIPWGYVYRNYIRRAGDPWMTRAVAPAGLTTNG